jgi:hypothetical protein
MEANTEKLRMNIYQLIDNEQDEDVLKAIRDVIKSILSIKKDRVAGYGAEGSPITREELENIVVNASKNSKLGKLTSHEELLQQLKNW